ncbi:MAG: FecR family protein, partial [Chitinophagaceae bacterium]|nr:FecR family protein [Chitinophagaceae bacterium]
LATNTMSTPRGGQYQLTLPDGSKVWLNAASSIRYPVTFGKTREVSITGEAWFEVAQNKSAPFIVKTITDEITVLGTSFNINSYSDEPAVKTSLAEGSIKINNKILKPGQAYINNQIISTNLAHDLAWKNNVFRFDSEDLPSILRQLSRWYDLDITNNSNIKSKFTGIISRNVNADEVLHMLEQTGKVHFKIEDRKIIVIN